MTDKNYQLSSIVYIKNSVTVENEIIFKSGRQSNKEAGCHNFGFFCENSGDTRNGARIFQCQFIMHQFKCVFCFKCYCKNALLLRWSFYSVCIIYIAHRRFYNTYIQVNIFRTIDDPVLILWFGALDASFDIQVQRLSMLSSYMKGSHSEIVTFVFFF